MAQYKIVTPSGQGYSKDAPEEGKLFKDTSGRIATIKGGQAFALDPGSYAQQSGKVMEGLGQELYNAPVMKSPQGFNYKPLTIKGKQYNWGGGNLYDQNWNLLGSAAESTDSGQVMKNIAKAAGLQYFTTGGDVANWAYGDLGIDPSKLPEYNMGDLGSYGITKGTEGALSANEAKQLYSSGGFATPDAGVKEVFGAEIPKIISGEGGPKDAQGNLIPPEKYAEYGITDNKIPTTTAGGQTNYWKSPSGTIVGVPVGSEAENNFKNLGWTQSTSQEELAGRQAQVISDTGEIKTQKPVNEAEFQRYLKDHNFTDPTVIAQYRDQWANMGAPPGYEGTGGQTPTGGQPGGQTTGTQGTAGAVNATTQNNQWVNDYYQKYFDRAATQAELDNWGKETPENLDAFLKQEAVRYGYTSKINQTEESQRLQSALDKINNSNLPEDLKALYRDVVKNYPPGIEFDANEILNTFTKIKNETIDPAYRNKIALAEKGFTDALSSIEQSKALEQEQLRTQAGANIRQAKEGLEKAGMTFTGKAIETLGAQAAIPQGATGAIPQQEPFGGLFYEGTVNQANRVASTSSQARYDEALKQLGLSAEQQLGTTGLPKIGMTGYTPVGGTVGAISEQKQREEAQTLQQLLGNYQKKIEANTNLTYNI